MKCRDEMSYLEDIGQNVDDSLKKQLRLQTKRI